MTDRKGLTVTQGGAADIPSDPDALADDIERTRRQVGDTVAALTTKLDAKARLGDTAGRVKAWIQDATGQLADRISDSGPSIAAAARRRRVRLALTAGGMLVTGAWLTWMVKRR